MRRPSRHFPRLNVQLRGHGATGRQQAISLIDLSMSVTAMSRQLTRFKNSRDTEYCLTVRMPESPDDADTAEILLARVKQIAEAPCTWLF